MSSSKNFRVIPSDRFKREAKRLVKKFPSLKEELSVLGRILTSDPESGTALGGSTYKLRLAIRSKGKGKSGGARVITYVVTEEAEVYLLTIYDKSEMDAIDTRAIRAIIDSLGI